MCQVHYEVLANESNPITPMLSMRDVGSEMVSNFPKVTEPENGSARVAAA